MRLTRKNELARFGYEYIAPHRLEHFGEGISKLGQLEDMEEELGIDLITLFKAIEKGVFYKGYKEPIKHTNNLTLNNYGRYGWCLGNKSHNFFLSEYGKYWALTKEELEK